MDLSGIKEVKKGNCRKYGKYKYYIKNCRSKRKTKEQKLN